jgi:phosphonate transport system substrate-binding protein
MKNNKTIQTIMGVFIVSLALLFTSCSSEPASKKPATYKIGYMICNSEEETLARFVPLTAWLSKKMGVNFEAIAIDTLNFSEHIDSVDFTHTNSLLYTMYNRYNGLEILAVEKRGELGNRSKGLVVSLKKSGIKTIDDLKGKTMLFGPMLAPTAYMSQIYALKQKGFDVDEDLAFYTIPTGSFKHEKVIYGILFGAYDAGAFPYYDFEIMIKQGKVDKEKFNILAEGPLIPYCNFAVTQRVDDKFAQQFKKTLLSITEDDTVEINGERVKILERAQVDGFTTAVDADFDIVRQMAKATNMPPYQEY